MSLTQFNRAPIYVVRETLCQCVDIPSWADALLLARPFSSPAALLACAAQLMWEWQPNEVDAALARHPRIGERTAPASHSEQEQAGIRTQDTTLAKALVDGNQRYEDTFGHVFLIRAAGRSGEEVLHHLHRRLRNTAEQERLETVQQLREITLLRLKEWVS